MTSPLSHQPDDPGVNHTPNEYAPLKFGKKRAEYSPQTIRIVRSNAGKVPAVTIASALCWKISKLQAFAAKHGIDLRYPPDIEPEPRGA